MSSIETWGDLWWDGQLDECRKNLLGIRDPQELENRERVASARRAFEVDSGAVEFPQTGDLAHLQAIHRHLFQDIYDWAGELRVTELVRPSQNPDEPPHEFVKPEDIARLADMAFTHTQPAQLVDLDRSEQIDHLARTYAACNVLHPFYEGNGRAQRLFLSQIAESNNLTIDWSRIKNQNEIMAEAFTVGYQPVSAALATAIDRAPAPEQKQDHAPEPEKPEAEKPHGLSASARAALEASGHLRSGPMPDTAQGHPPAGQAETTAQRPSEQSKRRRTQRPRP